MNLLCIDIGNTHVHFGLAVEDRIEGQADLPTPELDHPREGLLPHLERLQRDGASLSGVSFCSVVPPAAKRLRRMLDQSGWSLPVFQLTAQSRLGLPISYPHPAEIGQDRLANSVAAQALFGAPAIVIDLGTAVTFDIVTRAGGYEGGVIAPGVEIMRRYLHEQTALLPLLDNSLAVTESIGRSTVEAMRIGCVVGFAGMIQALLDRVEAELMRRGEGSPALIVTGGSAALLEGRLRQKFTPAPDLTLRGLALAFALNQAPGKDLD